MREDRRRMPRLHSLCDPKARPIPQPGCGKVSLPCLRVVKLSKEPAHHCRVSSELGLVWVGRHSVNVGETVLVGCFLVLSLLSKPCQSNAWPRAKKEEKEAEEVAGTSINFRTRG